MDLDMDKIEIASQASVRSKVTGKGKKVAKEEE